nr:ATP synthase F0 subunit 8 [Stenodryas sp. N127]
MPQMAPMNWLTLFIYFTMMLLLFNTVNFYSFLYKIKQLKKSKKQINFNWKW